MTDKNKTRAERIPPRRDGWEALRDDLNRCIESYADERVALATTRIGSGNSDLDREPLRCAEEILYRAIDRLLSAAPKEPEPAESPAKPAQCAYCHQWFPKPVELHHHESECKPAEPAQDDEAAIDLWQENSRTGSDIMAGIVLMNRLAREKANLRAEVERLRTIITAAATQIRVAHEKEDEGAPCAASNHYEEALNMLADHAGAWSPECAKLRDFTTLGMVCKENSDLRAFVAEWVDRFGFLAKRNKPDDICAIDEVACIITDDMDDLHAKLAAAEQETKRLRSALRIADDIIVRGDDPSGNEPEDVCQIIESFVVVRAKLADAHEQLRCPDCGCATPEEAEAGECGCDSPVCSVEVTTTVAKELCDVAKKLAAAEAHQSDRPLIPGNLIDRIDEHGQEWTRTERVRAAVAELVQPQTVEEITRLREKLAVAEERNTKRRK